MPIPQALSVSLESIMELLAMDRFALFATPLFVYDPPHTAELNRELKTRFLAEAEAHAGIKRANVGGWHSTPDVALRPEPCFQTAIQMIVDHTIDSMRLYAQSMGQKQVPQVRCGARAWAMIMRDGDYTILHDHGNAHWSASYYIDAGDADLAEHPESGLFVVTDPRGSIRPIPGFEEAQVSQFTIRPQTGRLVIFPGWLQHFVHTYRGTQPRITLACNLTLSLQ